jgi:hypothetical protein
VLPADENTLPEYSRIWGAAVLFLSALALLGAALFRLSREVGMGLSEADHYRP